MKAGDRVVCVTPATHKGNTVAHKGLVYTIIDISACQCGWTGFNIGIKGEKTAVCPECKSPFRGGIVWCWSKCFAPISYNSAHSELTNVVEEKLDVELPVRV